MEYFLLDGTIRSYDKANEAPVTNQSTQQVTEQVDTPKPSGLFSSIPFTISYIVFIIILFYFMAIRPQRKRDKQLKELQNEIKLGDWVLLDSGIYGKVAGISETIYTIEFGTNKGVLIPVLKSRIVAKGEPNFNVHE